MSLPPYIKLTIQKRQFCPIQTMFFVIWIFTSSWNWQSKSSSLFNICLYSVMLLLSYIHLIGLTEHNPIKHGVSYILFYCQKKSNVWNKLTQLNYLICFKKRLYVWIWPCLIYYTEFFTEDLEYSKRREKKIKGWKKTELSSQVFSPVSTESQVRAESEELLLKHGNFPFWFLLTQSEALQ